MQLDLFWCSNCGSVRALEERQVIDPSELPQCCGISMLWMSPAVDKTNRFGEPIGRRVQFTVEDPQRQLKIPDTRAETTTKPSTIRAILEGDEVTTK